MPIQINIMENEVLGPMIEPFLEKRFREGQLEGRQEGERAIVRRLIEKRLGSIPDWANAKLNAMPAAELESLSERLLDARTLEELLG